MFCAFVLVFLVPASHSRIQFGPSIKISDEFVILASKNIPSSDAKVIQGPHETLEKAQLRVAFLRMANPICSQCMWKPIKGELKANDFIVCKKCMCTQYCSLECMEKHKTIHSTWCCNFDSEPDQGAQKLMSISVDKEFNIEDEIAYKKWLTINKIRPSSVAKCIFD